MAKKARARSSAPQCDCPSAHPLQLCPSQRAALDALPPCLLHALLTEHGLCGRDLLSLSLCGAAPVAAHCAARALASSGRFYPLRTHTQSGRWPEALMFTDALSRFVSRSPGAVYAAGRNSAGQCGRPVAVIVETFAEVPGLEHAIHLAAGTMHSLAVTARGELFAAGDNFNGRLGLGISVQDAQFLRVNAAFARVDVGNRRAVQCAAGGRHSLVLTDEGVVLVAGDNSRGQLGFPDFCDRVSFAAPALPRGAGRIVQVAAGAAHSVVLSEGGRVYVCGDNVCGQLGVVSAKKAVGRFVHVEILPECAAFIAAGEQHTLVLGVQRRTVYGSGLNCTGQLGTGDMRDRAEFVGVANTWEMMGETVRSVKAGASFSLVVTSGERLLATGEFYYRNGEVRHRKKFGAILEGVQAAAAGWNHGVAVPTTASGTVFTAGENRHGELGIGNTEARGRFAKAGLPGKASFVTAGGSHSLVIVEKT